MDLYIMALFYVFAGVMHFVKPNFFLAIVPPFFQNPKLLVYLSGIAEIVLGIGLIYAATQSIAAYGIIALLIAVFPANVYMAIGKKFQKMSPWIRYGRLPLQFVLIWWAWIYT
jgi:uncharacterized membrane protein